MTDAREESIEEIDGEIPGVGLLEALLRAQGGGDVKGGPKVNEGRCGQAKHRIFSSSTVDWLYVDVYNAGRCHLKVFMLTEVKADGATGINKPSGTLKEIMELDPGVGACVHAFFSGIEVHCVRGSNPCKYVWSIRR